MSFLGRDGGLVRGDAAGRCSRSLASGPNTGATEVPTHRRASKLKSEPKSWYAPRLRDARPAVIAGIAALLGDCNETCFLSAHHAHSSIGRKYRLCSI